jgi:hypothetical protein
MRSSHRCSAALVPGFRRPKSRVQRRRIAPRVAAATLQAAVDIPEEDRDGYWTNLNFLNSLRELGAMRSSHRCSAALVPGFRRPKSRVQRRRIAPPQDRAAESCTDRRGASPVLPKIIASTATVRRYEDQIKGLFGAALVPGFRRPKSRVQRRRIAPPQDRAAERARRSPCLSASLGSTQTVQVRVAAATLQAAVDIPEEDRDGYWTNLNFLNSRLTAASM